VVSDGFRLLEVCQVGTIYKLIIEDDEGKTTVYPLSQGEISIGRKEGNTIRLMERNVSRRHARLLRNNGSVFIEDLDSYNGIRINGERINGRYEVKEGDLVEIGDYHLALQAAEIEEDTHHRDGPPTLEDRKEKDEWPLAGTVPDFRLPEEILAGVRGQLAAQKPAVSNAAPRDTLVDTPVQQVAPTPSVMSPTARSSGSQPPAMQARDPLISPPPRGDAEPPRSLPPFPLPGGLPPPKDPFLPGRNVPADNTELRKAGTPPVLKRADEPLPPTMPMTAGPARTATVPRLVCVSTSYAGREFALTRPELIIGRVEDNDIVIEHRSVSRNHAKVVFDGRVHKIIDLQSANGILVNGEEYAMTDLRKNDLIELGHVRFRFIPAGEAFVPSDDELREMREAGVSASPTEPTSIPPPLSSRSAEMRAADLRAPELPHKEASHAPISARSAPLSASPPREHAGDVTPGFDPSTAATVTDTPLSALTVGGLLTPEVMPTTLPSNEQSASPRRIEEKRRTDPAPQPVRSGPAHDQRPTEINIAARTNGAHGASSAEPIDAPAAADAKKTSKARAATEPMTRPGGVVEVEGRLDPPKMRSRVGLLVAIALFFAAVLVAGYVFLIGRAGGDLGSRIATLSANSEWGVLVDLCNKNKQQVAADPEATKSCEAARAKLLTDSPQTPENKTPDLPPEEGKLEPPPPELEKPAEKPTQPDQAVAVPSETDRRPVPPTKKAVPPSKPKISGAAEKRAKAKDIAKKARASLISGDMTTAEEGLKECLRLADLPECYRNLGVLYAAIKDTQNSIKYYRKYLELEPNGQDADYIRGLLEGAEN
jgi:pSer/pThr/pTyr-binding forkhead associated (FHA) protein